MLESIAVPKALQMRSQHAPGYLSKVEGVDKDSMSWKFLMISPPNSLQLSKDVHQGSCMDLHQ